MVPYGTLTKRQKVESSFFSGSKNNIDNLDLTVAVFVEGSILLCADFIYKMLPKGE